MVVELDTASQVVSSLMDRECWGIVLRPLLWIVCLWTCGIFMCVHICVWVSLPMPMCAQAKGWRKVYSFITIFVIFQKSFSYWTWNSLLLFLCLVASIFYPTVWLDRSVRICLTPNLHYSTKVTEALGILAYILVLKIPTQSSCLSSHHFTHGVISSALSISHILGGAPLQVVVLMTFTMVLLTTVDLQQELPPKHAQKFILMMFLNSISFTHPYQPFLEMCTLWKPQVEESLCPGWDECDNAGVH